MTAVPDRAHPRPDLVLAQALAADLDAADFRSEPLRALWGEEADDALVRGLREPILRHCEEVARRLRAEGLRAGALVLKVKRSDHSLVTRRSVAPEPLLEARELYALAIDLLERIPLEGVSSRLVGVSATALEPLDPVQRELFADHPKTGAAEKPRALGAVLDKIEERFGRDVIKRAGA